jgi:enamine deaminase RidA (YjgF/YER057c/UK114 family)
LYSLFVISNTSNEVFANLQLALAFIGADFGHVIKVTSFMVGLTHDVTVMLREVRAGYLSAERQHVGDRAGSNPRAGRVMRPKTVQFGE